MASSSLPISEEEIKKVLLVQKVITETDWEDAKKNASRRRRAIEEVLIERGFFNEQFLYELLGDLIKIPYANLRKIKLEPEIINLLDEKIARSSQAIPFALEQDKIKVAFVNPLKKDGVEAVTQALKKPILPYLTSSKNFFFAAHLYEKNITEELHEIINQKFKQVQGTPSQLDLPIIQIVDVILEYALFDQASDIHIEALPDAVVIRFRIDGELHDKVELPAEVHDAIVARIKILSNLKIDEHRVPQDGRFSFALEGQEESVRVSVIPAFYGEKIVMRLMTDDAQNFSLDNMGFSEKNIAIMNRQVTKPFGMILVVGPTGSGKTTTLYSILNILNTEEVNICTIEDPIEYGVHRVNQTQVNPAAGYDFANGLRALLRQDPDIIMIGEIRDNKTAQISVRAGLTGHLVLSTLHTNNAAGVPPRLLDMEVEPFLVASTLNVVIAQRLVRRICLKCIESYQLSTEEIQALSKEFDLEKMLQRFKELEWIEQKFTKFSELSFYKGKGCKYCHQSGYAGRISVMEILENTPEIQKAIIKNLSSSEIQEIAVKNGMVTIFEDGLQKALLGTTSIAEVLSIKRE
ncbi:MAG: putative ATPases involved in pili biogenesis, PilB-like protein s [Parcubacteria group bacterium GW2011_GWA2_36_10]|nr:MAG: putative ATPases involved in pili biogenesis, PilB-like protein s [Parcubacteria group bacterium GW2011_GWA2_36_10]